MATKGEWYWWPDVPGGWHHAHGVFDHASQAKRDARNWYATCGADIRICDGDPFFVLIREGARPVHLNDPNGPAHI